MHFGGIAEDVGMSCFTDLCSAVWMQNLVAFLGAIGRLYEFSVVIQHLTLIFEKFWFLGKTID